MLRFDRPEIKAAATPELLARGAVHVIGLEPLRDRAGARWDTVQASVHARLETLLRQQLGPSDFFAPLSDVAYLVTTPSAGHDDAEIYCLRIAYDFYASYLGHCDLGGIPIFRAGPSEDGKAILLHPISRSRISSIAARAGILDEMRAPRPEHKTGHKAPGAPVPVEAQALDAFVAEFLPIWDARNEVVTSYAAEPRKLFLKDGSPVTLHDLEPRERAKADLSCLRQGAAALMRHLEHGERFLMTVRVAFDTLAAPVTRMEFGALCRDLPSDCRQLLLFEIVSIPDGVPHGRLSDLLTVLRPYAKGVRAQVPAQCRNYLPYQGLALQAIGLDLSQRGNSASALHEEILNLRMAARRLTFATFLDGVAVIPALKEAREANVHFLSGPLIAAALPEPGPMMRLSWRAVAEAAQKGAAA